MSCFYRLAVKTDNFANGLLFLFYFLLYRFAEKSMLFGVEIVFPDASQIADGNDNWQ